MTKKLPVQLMYTAPIEALIDRAQLKCTVCGAFRGHCDCWTPCACGWSFLKGTACRNPDCTSKRRRSKRRSE